MVIPFQIEPIAEGSLLVRFQHSADATLAIHIGACAHDIMQNFAHRLMNVTPSYTTLLIDYLPYRVAQNDLIAQLTSLLNQPRQANQTNANIIELPVYYHPDVGPDLISYHEQGLSLQEVIQLHTSVTYTVCAIGFTPGFAFMTDVAEALRRPRRTSPRLMLPKGSVGIAENQTAIYPNASPGGWNIIGNCPVSLFNPDQTPMSPWQIGSQVRFRSIEREEFVQLGGVIQPQRFQ
ncbi:5-oxoprolinase subunit B family protein [Vibrio metoecus]|uniref:5-oxoprolinase subunit B family protein n=1 Tax=Vibrio metoecus TaxID=1481663 RepID=UPI00215BE891|nr:allophanate hydrolase subunit 1 [Vibrio metoecus]MCR9387230.1 allophanate hydrolase subunit 1 [Vibrio metoecus]